MANEGPRTTLLGARIGFHETQLPRSERELLAVFFDELGATVTEGSSSGRSVPRPSTSGVGPAPGFTPGGTPAPSATVVQSSLFDNKEAA